MRALLVIFLISSAQAAVPGNADSLFRKFWKSPTAGNLKAFKKSCTVESQPKFEGGVAWEIAKKDAKKANLAQIRALLYAHEHCSDGAAAESLAELLGNDILLARPALFIEAVALEKPKSTSGMLKISPTDAEGAECETNQCREEAKAYFAKKTEAIRSAEITKKYEPARQDLLLSSWGK